MTKENKKKQREHPRTEVIHISDQNIYYLMNKNRKVLEFYLMENDFGETSLTETNRNPTEPLPIGYKNIHDWLATRRAPKNRKHMAELLSNCGCDDLGIFIHASHALTLQDTFWIKQVDEQLTWEQVSLYENKFDPIVAKIAFEGRPFVSCLRTQSVSPEYTTDGTYPKCWKRRKDGIVLLKQGSDRMLNREVWSEKYASEVAEKICHCSVAYRTAKYRGQYISECTLFTSEQTGYVPMWIIEKSATPEGMLTYMKKHGAEDDFRRMLVLDALILNTDRHTGNYGMLFNTDTMEILGMAPVFDHNRALLPEVSDRWIGEENVTRGIYPKIGKDFNLMASDVLTPEIKADLKNLHGFKFSRDGEAGLPETRLLALERIISRQIDRILGRIQLNPPPRRYTAENVSPDSYVGLRTEIGPNVRIRDSDIEDRAKVLENAYVDGSTICHEAHVAGNARITGSLIKDSACVAGNVVVMDGATIGGDVTLDGDQIIGTDAQVFEWKDIYACGRMGGETAPCEANQLPERLTFYKKEVGTIGVSFSEKGEGSEFVSATEEHFLEYAKTEEKVPFEAALQEARRKILGHESG